MPTLGSMERGEPVDFFGGNPLEDPRNTNRVEGLMLNGRLYAGDTLDEV